MKHIILLLLLLIPFVAHSQELTAPVVVGGATSFAGLTGSAACAQLPALTGAVTTSAGSCATAIGTLTTQSLLRTVTVPVSSAQLLALSTTPISIVSSPGSNKFLWPHAIYVTYQFLTAPYTTGNLETVNWIGRHDDKIYPGTTPCLSATQSVVCTFSVPPYIDSTIDTMHVSDIVNRGLEFGMDTGASNPTGGSGSADVTIVYVVIDALTGAIIPENQASPAGLVWSGTAGQLATWTSTSVLQGITTLPATNFPALTGDVTTTAGSFATAIGAGKVTNTMLVGSIAASKLVGTDIATVGTLTAGATGAGFTVALSTSTITGTLADARLSTNVPLKDAANVFTANQTISSTAPSLIMTDTTASAKSLAIAVDGNKVEFRESAAAAGSMMTFDLENNRVGFGTSSPQQAISVGNALYQTFLNSSGVDGLYLTMSAGNVAGMLTLAYLYPIELDGSEVRLQPTSTGGVVVGHGLTLTNIKSSTGTLFLCVSTTGVVTAATACTGT